MRVFLLLLFVYTGCVSNHKIPSLLRSPAGKSLSSIAPIPIDPNQHLTFKKLVSFIRQHRPRKIDDVLLHLRTNYAEYMKYHTFVYDTRSIQEASFENPRAIVFGNDANVVLTFNGDPSQGAYHSLEVMNYDEKKKTFEFHEIVFPDESKVGLTTEEIAKYRRDPISEANPQKCMHCHAMRSTPHPLWDTYGLWQGVYGSEDDSIFRRDDAAFWRTYGKTFDGLEEDKFAEFQKKRPQKDRYKRLPQMSVDFFGHSRINTYFTVLLVQSNLDRIARLIHQDPKLRKYKYKLVGRLLCGWQKFNRNNFREMDWDKLKPALLKNRAVYQKQRNERHLELVNSFATEEMITMNKQVGNILSDDSEFFGIDQTHHTFAQIEDVVREAGQSTNGWSTLLDPPNLETISFATGLHDRTFFQTAFLKEFFTGKGEEKLNAWAQNAIRKRVKNNDVYEPVETLGYPQFCDEIKSLSKAHLGSENWE